MHRWSVSRIDVLLGLGPVCLLKILVGPLNTGPCPCRFIVAANHHPCRGRGLDTPVVRVSSSPSRRPSTPPPPPSIAKVTTQMAHHGYSVADELLACSPFLVSPTSITTADPFQGAGKFARLPVSAAGAQQLSSAVGCKRKAGCPTDLTPCSSLAHMSACQAGDSRPSSLDLEASSPDFRCSLLPSILKSGFCLLVLEPLPCKTTVCSIYACSNSFPSLNCCLKPSTCFLVWRAADFLKASYYRSLFHASVVQTPYTHLRSPAAALLSVRNGSEYSKEP